MSMKLWTGYPLKRAKNEIENSILNQRSPLCWVKAKTHKPQKCFITWW